MSIQKLPTLLGLTGHKFCGKDTASTLLLAMADGAGMDAEALSLSYVLYKEVAQAFDVTHEQLMAMHEKSNKTHPELALRHCKERDFLAFVDAHNQRHLTHAIPRELRAIIRLWGIWRQSLDPAYLIKFLHGRIIHLRASGVEHIIVRDIRRVQEAEYLRAHGGEVWCLYRNDGKTRDDPYMSKLQPSRRIPNNSDLNRLRVTLRHELAGG